jgi:LL-H family phage holin
MENPWVKIAMDVLAVLIPALVGLSMEYLRRRLGTEKMRKIQEELLAKKELALLAIKMVEQIYIDIKGQEKYDKAAEWLSQRCKDYGIAVTSDEIQGLIEAAIRTLKDELGDDWANAIQE